MDLVAQSNEWIKKPATMGRRIDYKIVCKISRNKDYPNFEKKNATFRLDFGLKLKDNALLKSVIFSL